MFGVFLETAMNGLRSHLENRGINIQNIIDRYELIVTEIMLFSRGDNTTNMEDVFEAIFADTGFEKLYVELFLQIGEKNLLEIRGMKRWLFLPANPNHQ